MNQVIHNSVQEKIKRDGTIIRLRETYGISTNGYPFYRNVKTIGQVFLSKTYHKDINGDYTILVMENDNLASDESFHWGLVIDFEEEWENEWWPNDSGDH